MVSAREIQAVAELLQISPEGLQKAITFKVTVSLWALETDKASAWTELPYPSSFVAHASLSSPLCPLCGSTSKRVGFKPQRH